MLSGWFPTLLPPRTFCLHTGHNFFHPLERTSHTPFLNWVGFFVFKWGRAICGRVRKYACHWLQESLPNARNWSEMSLWSVKISANRTWAASQATKKVGEGMSHKYNELGEGYRLKIEL